MTTTKVVFAKLSLTETIKFHKPQKVHAKTKINGLEKKIVGRLTWYQVPIKLLI